MNEFISMGGYAFYVWTSYAIAAVVMAINVVGPFHHHKQKLLIAAEIRRVSR